MLILFIILMETLNKFINKKELTKKYLINNSYLSISNFVFECTQAYIGLAKKLYKNSNNLKLNQLESEVFHSLEERLKIPEKILKKIHHPVYWHLFLENPDNSFFKLDMKKERECSSSIFYISLDNKFGNQKVSKLSRGIKEDILKKYSNYYISKFETLFGDSNKSMNS